MKSSWFSRMLSYFVDLSLESTTSDYNPYLEVRLVNGRHQLITDNAIYSFDDKYDNFYKTFKALDWSLFSNSKVLVLGLGLGSVIYMLENIFKCTFEYHCVEIDPEIIRLAHHYTLKDIHAPVSIYETDAVRFLDMDSEKYDLVIMDIFQNAKIPSCFDSVEMLEVLKSKLAPGALLLYNRMNTDKDDIARNNTFKTEFDNIFENATSISVKDNLILISDYKFVN